MLSTLQQDLGYVFSDGDLLLQALTHSSFTHEKLQADSYERLEFLGDAVLELSVSELLYLRYPRLTEGELTKRRAALVCEPSLAVLARKLHLGTYIRLGHGEAQSGGHERDSLLADVLEAVFGAVYLDGGFTPARALIRRLFDPIADSAVHSIDPKTTLQELIQTNSREPLVYTIVSETGPAHQREFVAAVTHEGQEMGRGTGRSKKDAEQKAALMALERLHESH